MAEFEFGDQRLPQRFWNKVTVLENGCWLWTAFRNKDGYGRFRVGKRMNGTAKTVLAHDLSYEALVGPIPSQLEPDHTCRNPACVNPGHLELITHRENCIRGNSGKEKREQTQCAKGHPFDLQNTGYATGRRYCRICKILRAKKYREAKKS